MNISIFQNIFIFQNKQRFDTLFYEYQNKMSIQMALAKPSGQRHMDGKQYLTNNQQKKVLW